MNRPFHIHGFHDTLGAETVVYPPEQAPSGVLCERAARFVLLHCGVSVHEGSRGNKYDGAGRKLNHQAQITQDQVAAEFRIEATASVDSAPFKRRVCCIRVFQSCDLRPEIEGGGGKHAVGENAFEMTLVIVDLLRHNSVLTV